MNAFFQHLTETSWQLAFLVVFVLVLELGCARKLAPRWRYALWLVVVARLALPVQIEVAAGIWERASLAPDRWTAFQRPAIPRSSDGEGPRAAGQRPAGQGAPKGLEPAVIRGSQEKRGGSSLADRGPLAPTSPVPPDLTATAESSPRRASTWLWLRRLWALGAGLFFVRACALEAIFRRRIRAAGGHPVVDGELARLLDECRHSVGLRRRVALVVTEAVASPAVHGLLRPRLFLPPAIVREFSAPELRLLFLHELAHVRRFDVALNAALELLRCIYWFHPLVHLSLRRLHAAQESVRDWDALRASPVRELYARTLIKVLERLPKRPESVPALGFLASGRHLTRRIQMITRFDSVSRTQRFFGLASLVALAWIAFTSAARVEADAPETADQEPLRSLKVERHEDPPAWRLRLEERMDAPISIDLEDVSLRELVDHVAEAGKVNLVVDQDILEETDGHSLSFSTQGTPLRRVLDLVCRMVSDDLAVTYSGEVIVMGDRWNLPQSFELRFYNVEPLLDGLPEEDGEAGLDQLMELLRDFAEPGSWDEYTETSLQTWNRLLVVSQTEPIHEAVETFLVRLLNRGRREERTPEAWEIELESVLNQPVSVSFTNMDLARVGELLTETAGIPVVVDPDRQDEHISLRLEDVSFEAVLGWVAELTDLWVRPSDGALLLNESPEFTIEMYEVKDLVGAVDDGFGEDVLDELIRGTVRPESWDEWEEPRIDFWGDLMVVRQTPHVHARLKSFLKALRRAGGADSLGEESFR